jgi:hypothetical protein
MSDTKTRVIHCITCDRPFPEKMEEHPPYFGQIKLFIQPNTLGGVADRLEELHVLLTRTAAVQEALRWLTTTDCSDSCFCQLLSLSEALSDEAAARLWRAMNKLAGLIDPAELRAELGLDKEPEEHPDGQEETARMES